MSSAIGFVECLWYWYLGTRTTIHPNYRRKQISICRGNPSWTVYSTLILPLFHLFGSWNDKVALYRRFRDSESSSPDAIVSLLRGHSRFPDDPVFKQELESIRVTAFHKILVVFENQLYFAVR